MIQAGAAQTITSQREIVSVGGVTQPPLQDGDTVTNAAVRLLEAGS